MSEKQHQTTIPSILNKLRAGRKRRQASDVKIEEGEEKTKEEKYNVGQSKFEESFINQLKSFTQDSLFTVADSGVTQSDIRSFMSVSFCFQEEEQVNQRSRSRNKKSTKKTKRKSKKRQKQATLERYFDMKSKGGSPSRTILKEKQHKWSQLKLDEYLSNQRKESAKQA